MSAVKLYLDEDVWLGLAVDYFFDERFHAGVILSPQIEKGELLRRVRVLLQSLSAEETLNTIRYLSDYK